MIRKLVAHLPPAWQQSAKRRFLSWQIRHGTFPTRKVSSQDLRRWLNEGDWVIDVGANVGHYTARFSEAVGATGRVIAVEPVPETFELLAHCAHLLPYHNVTPLNIGASDSPALRGMVMPRFPSGLKNPWRAKIIKGGATPELYIFCMPMDLLQFPHRIALVKIDAEGHDAAVLKGMSRLLKQDRPVVVVESKTQEIFSLLRDLDYKPATERMYRDQIFCAAN